MTTQIPSETELVKLAEAAGKALQMWGLTCALAESCTGGLVGHLITEIAGSSAYFAGSAVVYSNEAKEHVLGVSREALTRHGAVSAEVAQEMARRALTLYGAGVVVAVTGVAGPGGGTAEKPVGTVYLHLSGADGVERGERFVWPADREGNKRLSAQAAIQMILEYATTREKVKGIR